KRYDNFKRKVLNIAEKELIQHTDIFFEYEEIKTGKKVTGISFRILINRDNTVSKELSEQEKFRAFIL
ncbi:replication initiation protein, partial [Aliarcobacter cryaerophilus]